MTREASKKRETKSTPSVMHVILQNYIGDTRMYSLPIKPNVRTIFYSFAPFTLFPLFESVSDLRMLSSMANALSSSSLRPTSCRLTGMPWTASAESTIVSIQQSRQERTDSRSEYGHQYHSVAGDSHKMRPCSCRF